MILCSNLNYTFASILRVTAQSCVFQVNQVTPSQLNIDLFVLISWTSRDAETNLERLC